MRMMNRLHGWLADHLPWVQYPPERDARFSFRTRYRSPGALSLDMRIGVGLLSLFWVLVLLVILAAMLAVGWIVLAG